MDATLLQIVLESLFLSDFLNQRIEPILDLILCSTLDFLGYQGPLVANQLLFLEKHQVLLGCPLFALDVRGKEIDPSLSTLLALSLVKTHPPVDFTCNLLPLLGSALTHELPKHGVLLEGPGHLLRLLLVLALPLIVTLVIVAAWD